MTIPVIYGILAALNLGVAFVGSFNAASGINIAVGLYMAFRSYEEYNKIKKGVN